MLQHRAEQSKDRALTSLAERTFVCKTQFVAPCVTKHDARNATFCFHSAHSTVSQQSPTQDCHHSINATESTVKY